MYYFLHDYAISYQWWRTRKNHLPGWEFIRSIHNTHWTAVDSFPPSAAYMRRWNSSTFVQIMACRLFGTKPLSKPMMGHCQLHDVQFSCAINQPLLAHHWRVHQCLPTSRFIAPSIPWGVSAPGGKVLKQLLEDHNFLHNSPIFIIESSTFNIFAFQKALHTIHFNLRSCFGFGERYLTP